MPQFRSLRAYSHHSASELLRHLRRVTVVIHGYNFEVCVVACLLEPDLAISHHKSLPVAENTFAALVLNGMAYSLVEHSLIEPEKSPRFGTVYFPFTRSGNR